MVSKGGDRVWEEEDSFSRNVPTILAPSNQKMVFPIDPIQKMNRDTENDSTGELEGRTCTRKRRGTPRFLSGGV